VRRALGASRGSVFAQHLVECEVVALLGGAVGLALSVGTLRVLNRLFTEGAERELFTLDLTMLGAGVALALAAGIVAGAYPAWRICRVAPATYLKQQ
jgi:putative ABC transport system permease protein